MTAASPSVFVVVDDAQLAQSISSLVASYGGTVHCYGDVSDFLESYEGRPGCLVIDLNSAGVSGVDVQRELRERQHTLPAIMLTRRPETKLTVQALKNGAVTVFELPYREDDLWQAMREAVVLGAEKRQQEAVHRDFERRLQQLAPAERRVFELMVTGLSNKEMASLLDVSVRTIETRRHKIFRTLETKSLAKVVRMFYEAEACRESSSNAGKAYSAG